MPKIYFDEKIKDNLSATAELEGERFLIIHPDYFSKIEKAPVETNKMGLISVLTHELQH